jgi:hypothetical protein
MRDKKTMTYVSNEPQNFDINDTVTNLDFKVIGNFESKGAKVDLKHNNPI